MKNSLPGEFSKGPLRIDNEYRGRFAVHVKSHRKLGTHKTLLIDALPLINGILRHPAVWRVHLGLITTPRRKQLGFWIKPTPKTLEVLLSNWHRMQYFTIDICQPDGHQVITNRLFELASSTQFSVIVRSRFPKLR